MIKVLVIITALNGLPYERYTISDEFILVEWLSTGSEQDLFSTILFDIKKEQKLIINQSGNAVKHRVETRSFWESWSMEANLIDSNYIQSKFSDKCIQLKFATSSIFGEHDEDNILYLELCDLPILYKYLPKDELWLSQFLFSRFEPRPFAEKEYPFATRFYSKNDFDTPDYSNIESLTETFVPSNFFQDWQLKPVIDELKFYGKEWVEREISQCQKKIDHYKGDIAKCLEKSDKDLLQIAQEQLQIVSADLKRLQKLLNQSEH